MAHGKISAKELDIAQLNLRHVDIDTVDAAPVGMSKLVVSDAGKLTLVDDQGLATSVADDFDLLAARIEGATQIPMPLGFDYEPTIKFYKDSNGYFSDFVADEYLIESVVTYYLSPDGNDANNGTTPNTPKRSLDALIVALNATPPAGATIYLAPGFYLNANGLQDRSINFPCNIICEGGRAVIASTRDVTWSATPDVTFTNTYTGVTASSTDQANVVVDLLDRDENGLPRRFENYSTNQLVDDNPGSVTNSGTTLRVRLRRSGAPDSNVLHLGSVVTLSQTTANSLFFRNVDFWGGGPTARINTAGTATFVFDRCTFGLSVTGDAITAISGSHLVIFNRCVAAYARTDGFDYDGSVKGIELNCLGYRCGFIGTSAGSDNASTAHNSAVTIRMGCVYTDTKDRIVHDINTTRNLLLGCKSGRTYSTGTTNFDRIAYACGVEANAQVTRTWMIDCESLGGVNVDAGAYGGGVLRYSGPIMPTTVGDVRREDNPQFANVVKPTEWTAETISQVEAETGTATTRRAWTAQRVAQAIAAQSGSVIEYSPTQFIPDQPFSLSVNPLFSASGFQWFELVDNVWALLVGETDDEIDLGTVDAEDAGRVFRCEIQGPHTTVISKSMVLSNGWTPLDLGADLAFWLDSEAGIFQERTSPTTVSGNGDPVGTWRDQKNNHDFIAASSVSLPIVSGQYLTFDGTDDRMTIPSAQLGVGQNASYLYVFQAVKISASSAQQSSFWISNNSTSLRAGVLLNRAGTYGRLAVLARQLDGGSAVTCEAESQFSANDEFVITGEFTWGSQLLRVRKNGVSVATAAIGDGGATSDTPSASGWIGFQPTTAYFASGLGQTIVCRTSSPMSDATRQTIENYIANRHGISL